jgi:transposase InsO family protein
MKLIMKNVRNLSIPELEQLVSSNDALAFIAIDKAEAYGWISETLATYRYRKLSKHERGIISVYIRKMTGYSQRQTKRLIARWLKATKLVRKTYKHHRFNGTYTRDDCILLAHVDEAHNVLSGPATRIILEREYIVFEKHEYERLSGISVSHIYNLRKTYLYHQHVAVFTKTKGPKNTLGVRRKPEPNGKPGYIRIDSVHQGDGPNGEKGVYHINFVDEVTQWEFVACVPTICDRDMLPVLEAILFMYPFVIIEFHADNGSEYINKQVAKMLKRLHITLSKSRPRRHEDNALAETKNGGVIRKEMSYNYIPSHYAELIHAWYLKWFNPYLNYHRPCGFVTTITDSKGKERKVYKPQDYMTPYTKLKSIPDASQYLKPGVTFAHMDAVEEAMSDTDFAVDMRKAKYQLMKIIDESEAKELPME